MSVPAAPEVSEETREGFIFWGHVGKPRKYHASGGKRPVVPVTLFLEGRAKAVGTILTTGWGSRDQIVDRAFQKWVMEGVFFRTIDDSLLLAALGISQSEREDERPWYSRTFRFLRTKGRTPKNPRFILTSDKSDLPDRYKRIIAVGESQVLLEEAQAEEERRLKRRLKKKEEQLSEEHAELIKTLALQAINQRRVPVRSVQILEAAGLLTPSTEFRMYELFPGESATLRFDFEEGGKAYNGWLGFTKGLRLLSIGGNCPDHLCVYLGRHGEGPWEEGPDRKIRYLRQQQPPNTVNP